MSEQQFPKGGRPKEVELVTKDKFTYTRLGNMLMVFPTDCVSKDELQLIQAINHAYDRNNTQVLTADQHNRLVRLREYQVRLMVGG